VHRAAGRCPADRWARGSCAGSRTAAPRSLSLPPRPPAHGLRPPGHRRLPLVRLAGRRIYSYGRGRFTPADLEAIASEVERLNRAWSPRYHSSG
jgi:hypothetical protein